MACISTTYAQETWDHGGGADTLWSNNLNWLDDTAPAANADILFSNNAGLGTQTVTLGAGVAVNSLTFDSGASYIITTSTAQVLTFGNTGIAGLPSITLTDYEGGSGPKANQEINTPVTITETLTITNNTADNLTFNGAITLTGGITVDGPGAVNIDGNLVGTGTITKNGTGTLFIRRAAGIVGTRITNVNAGVLSLDSAASITDSNGTSVVTIASGASLELIPIRFLNRTYAIRK